MGSCTAVWRLSLSHYRSGKNCAGFELRSQAVALSLVFLMARVPIQTTEMFSKNRTSLALTTQVIVPIHTFSCGSSRTCVNSTHNNTNMPYTLLQTKPPHTSGKKPFTTFVLYNRIGIAQLFHCKRWTKSKLQVQRSVNTSSVWWWSEMRELYQLWL